MLSGMDLTGYELRPPTRDDFEAVARVLVASELARSGQSTLGADFVGGEWSQPGFDLAADAWAAVDARSGIVGYGQVRRVESDVVESWGVVHPDHGGRGIGSAVFERIEHRAGELLAGQAAARFRHAVDAGDAGADAILSARGLRPVRHFWHMQIDLTGPVPPGPDPAGIAITGVASDDDLRAAHAVIDDALAEHWGHHHESFDQWFEELSSTPGHDPGLWLLAVEAGRPVGALTASVGHQDGGWIDWLGVLADHRGRGLASALLRRSFALFADRGVTQVRVSVDSSNASGATGVYERAGMRTIKGWEMWERCGERSTFVGVDGVITPLDPSDA